MLGTGIAPLLLDTGDKVLTCLGIFAVEEHVEFANVGLIAVGCNSWEAFIASMSSYSRITLGIVLDKEANGRLDQHLSRCLVLDGKHNVIYAFSIDELTIQYKSTKVFRRDHR